MTTEKVFMKDITKQLEFEERTAKFGENIIDLCKMLPVTVITRPIINQLIRSATSIGANYMEANCASSKKDFTNKIYICKKEAQETKHWLKMLLRCLPEKAEKILSLADECQQLVLIFQKITSTIRQTK